jgi:2-methylcitrate dehydratase PrpD
MDALETLAAFYETQREAELPRSATDVMRLCLLDWLIVGRAAKGDAVAESALAYAGGQGEASLFFGGGATARMAALANGTVSHALDYDDTHFAHIGHVSTVVIPAAVAVGEARGASFETILRAALMGAEAATRFGVWLGRDHYQIGYHQTATAGAIGAAVAASIAAGHSVARAALSNAAGFAAGLKAQFGTGMKPVNAGMAAANGVEAVLMAEAGLSGSEAVFEAFAETHHGIKDHAAWDGIGETWFFEAVTHKFYPCCHGTHAMIEALSEALQRMPAPERITVRTHPRWMSVCNKPSVKDALEAKFSYRALAALLIQNGGTGVDEVGLQGLFPMTDAARAIMAQVEVIAVEGVSEEASRVTLEAGGQVVQVEHDLRAPMSFEARLEKLLAKGEGVLPKAEAARFWDVVQSADVQALLSVITE